MGNQNIFLNRCSFIGFDKEENNDFEISLFIYRFVFYQ